MHANSRWYYKDSEYDNLLFIGIVIQVTSGAYSNVSVWSLMIICHHNDGTQNHPNKQENTTITHIHHPYQQEKTIYWLHTYT